MIHPVPFSRKCYVKLGPIMFAHVPDCRDTVSIFQRQVRLFKRLSNPSRKLSASAVVNPAANGGAALTLILDRGRWYGLFPSLACITTRPRVTAYRQPCWKCQRHAAGCRRMRSTTTLASSSYHKTVFWIVR